MTGFLTSTRRQRDVESLGPLESKSVAQLGLFGDLVDISRAHLDAVREEQGGSFTTLRDGVYKVNHVITMEHVIDLRGSNYPTFVVSLTLILENADGDEFVFSTDLVGDTRNTRIVFRSLEGKSICMEHGEPDFINYYQNQWLKEEAIRT